MKQSSAETATKLSNQKCRSASSKVKSTKGKMKADHSQALVIASILTKRCSRKHSVTSKVNGMQPGPQSPQKKFKQTAKKLAGKVVKRTLNVSKPSRPGRFPGVPKYQKKNVAPDCGRNLKDQKRVCQFSENGSGNHAARLLRSRTPRVSTKVQPKTVQAKRERKKQRNHQHKRTVDESHQDHILRIKKRVKYLLNRIKLEQNLIDAYSAEGWKGQSREKIRPERELQRAEAQITHFQLGIREAVQQLDSLGLEGSIEDSVFDSQGRIYHEDIFCAKCKLQDALEDNDIILCDGACNRAFHQLCLEPPLKTEDIPPGDEGWLCPVCECKLECLDVVNAYLGTCYHVDDHWKKIFAEAAAEPSGDGDLIPAVEEWPSEDSEDDDYNPDYDDHQTCMKSEDQEGSNDLRASSGQCLHGKETGSDSSDDHSEISLEDEFAGSIESDLFITDGCEGKKKSEEPGLEDENNVCLVEGKRQRKEVDYKKLHDEMFGKDALAEEASEDEEWGPRKRLKKLKQSDDFFQQDSKVHVEKQKSIKEAENIVSTKTSDALHNKQSRVRLPPNAVEKLRAVFKENSLPSKECKEGLSRQLGLSFQKVNFWFKNVRYAALKKGLVQRTNNRAKLSTGHHCTTEAVPGFHVSAAPSKIINGVKKEKAIEQKRALSGLLLEMEMLCDAQLKVESMKRMLQEEKLEALSSDRVMYVAVAELREKVPS